jgi:type IV secretory pathway TrbD component
MSNREGFEQPLIRALTEIILLGGMPREVAILNATMHGAAFMQTTSFILIGTFLIVTAVLVRLTKEDPEFFYVFRRHIWQKKEYVV